MDILDDILTTLNLKGVLYFRTDFSGDWGATVPDLPGAARFHLVVQGSCHVAFPSGRTEALHPGDLILIPGGRSHVLADKPGQPAPPLETVMLEAGYDGSGVFALGRGCPTASTQMICGHFSFRSGADHALLRALPEALISTPADRRRQPLLEETLSLVVRQIFSTAPGSPASVKRLSESIFIELVRIGADQDENLRAILTGLQDRQIGKALILIHERPNDSWSVERLAAACGMSRSRFADRFRSLLAMTPMAYLNEWRLQRALSLLDVPEFSVQQVATQTGYQSPAAFARAFSAKFGASPTEYRRASV